MALSSGHAIQKKKYRCSSLKKCPENKFIKNPSKECNHGECEETCCE